MHTSNFNPFVFFQALTLWLVLSWDFLFWSVPKSSSMTLRSGFLMGLLEFLLDSPFWHTVSSKCPWPNHLNVPLLIFNHLHLMHIKFGIDMHFKLTDAVSSLSVFDTEYWDPVPVPTDSWEIWCPVWGRRGITNVLSEGLKAGLHTHPHTWLPPSLPPSSLHLALMHTFKTISPAHADYTDPQYHCSSPCAVYNVHSTCIHSDRNKHKSLETLRGRDMFGDHLSERQHIHDTTSLKPKTRRKTRVQ